MLPRGPARPALDPLALSFQLKLLWLSGYQPHLESCAECGAVEALVGYLPAAGGAVCRDWRTGAMPLSPEGVRAIQALLAHRSRTLATPACPKGRAREALRVLTASYEEHGGFRLRTASA